MAKIVTICSDQLEQDNLRVFLSSKQSYEVIAQESNLEPAVTKISQLAPDVIVVDLNQQPVNSFSLICRIREMSNARIVVLSSNVSEHIAIEAFKRGANAFCLKRMGISGLFTAIQAALEGALYLDPQLFEGVVNCMPMRYVSSNVEFTEKELQVVGLLVKGYSNVDISSKTYVSLSTVKKQMKIIMKKLNAEDRVRAAVQAIRLGLVP
jgi:two-component system, NarL family, response regulator LiaR